MNELEKNLEYARGLILKVVQVWLDPDRMEEFNIITNIDAFRECNWCDYSTFEYYPELKDYAPEEKLELLKNKEIDYLVFRIDY
jgi:hypothetical protein